MGQRVLRIGQEVGRNPHEKAELATAVGVESFHRREHPRLGLDEGARAEVNWEERGGPGQQLSSTSLPGSLTKPSTPRTSQGTQELAKAY